MFPACGVLPSAMKTLSPLTVDLLTSADKERAIHLSHLVCLYTLDAGSNMAVRCSLLLQAQKVSRRVKKKIRKTETVAAPLGNQKAEMARKSHSHGRSDRSCQPPAKHRPLQSSYTGSDSRHMRKNWCQRIEKCLTLPRRVVSRTLRHQPALEMPDS